VKKRKAPKNIDGAKISALSVGTTCFQVDDGDGSIITDHVAIIIERRDDRAFL
jgi:hypothetical protein